MSKFIEKLEAISRKESSPIGFGARAAAQKSGSMLVVAALTNTDPAAAQVAEQGGADAALIPLGILHREREGLEATMRVFTSGPRGVLVDYATAEEAAELNEMDLDFLVFRADRTPAAVLGLENMGKVLEIDTSLSDSHIRATDAMAVDAMLVSEYMGHGIAYNVDLVLVLARLAMLTQKPILLLAPTVPSADELKSFRDAGVKALLLAVDAETRPEDISSLKKAIEDLPPPARGKRRHAEALLPLPQQRALEPPEEEEE